jgi:hypothetical protein
MMWRSIKRGVSYGMAIVIRGDCYGRRFTRLCGLLWRGDRCDVAFDMVWRSHSVAIPMFGVLHGVAFGIVRRFPWDGDCYLWRWLCLAVRMAWRSILRGDSNGVAFQMAWRFRCFSLKRRMVGWYKKPYHCSGWLPMTAKIFDNTPSPLKVVMQEFFGGGRMVQETLSLQWVAPHNSQYFL